MSEEESISENEDWSEEESDLEEEAESDIDSMAAEETTTWEDAYHTDTSDEEVHFIYKMCLL